MSAVTFFIWKGATFRAPVSTLQRNKTEGGWGLVDVATKCRALLLARMYLQGTREGTATASWLQAWELHGNLANPPHVMRYPIKLARVRAYATDMAYVTLPRHDE
jgi:hypothetical protein